MLPSSRLFLSFLFGWGGGERRNFYPSLSHELNCLSFTFLSVTYGCNMVNHLNA